MVEGRVMGKSLKGQVKWFNAAKGYGFLNGQGTDKDIFVHYSSITMDGFKTLKEGQPVEYTLVETARGLQAADVKKLDE